MNDSGLYAVILALSKSASVRVGKLGNINFEKGRYVYIGSAKRNLDKRIARHKRREKPLRWHIDYLRKYCRWESFVVYPDLEDECRLAEKIETVLRASRPHRMFGASDCRCEGHLIVTEIAAGKVKGKIDNLEHNS